MEGLQWGAGDNSVVQHIKQILVKKQSTQYLIGVNLMATGCSWHLPLSKRLHVSHSLVRSTWNPARPLVDEISTVDSKPWWVYHWLQRVIRLVMLSWQETVKLDTVFNKDLLHCSSSVGPCNSKAVKIYQMTQIFLFSLPFIKLVFLVINISVYRTAQHEGLLLHSCINPSGILQCNWTPD